MGTAEAFAKMLARTLLRTSCQLPRRNFCAAGGDSIKDLFTAEFAALSKRLEAARNVEQDVPEAVFKAMEEEAAQAKLRSGLSGIGEVPLSKKLKIGNL